jgi:predicted secreted protein
MATNKMPGNLLGLNINGSFISCETSCEFSFDAEMRGASPILAGRWKEVIPGIRSWSISLNAAMLLQAAGSNVLTVLNAFMTGEELTLRFSVKNFAVSDFVLSGKAFVQSGTISAPVNSGASWNTVLTGSGAFSIGDQGSFIAQYGYINVDPIGNETSLVPQFGKTYPEGATSLDFDFTRSSAGQFLFAIIPAGQKIFNAWENNYLNFGPIPDYLWRAPITIGDKNYYLTRSVQYITSETPVIVFKYKNNVPDQFAFVDVTEAERNTIYISNTIVLTGLTEPAPISISISEYRVNGGAWVSSAGSVNPGDSIEVRLTSGATFESATGATLTVGGISDTYSVTTRAAADVSLTLNYSVSRSTNPYVWNGLLFRRNGNEFLRIDSSVSSSQVFAFKEGDIIGVYQFTFPDSVPWPPLSTAYLQVYLNGVLSYNGNQTTEQTELQSFSTFLSNATTVIQANASASSSATGYATKTVLNTNNRSVGDFETRILDNTGSVLALDIEPQNGISNNDFNVLNDGGSVNVTVFNNSGTSASVRAVGTGYDVTMPIAAGSNYTFVAISKNNLSITYT